MAKTLQHIGLSVKRLQMRHHRAANAGLAKLDLTLPQWDALRHLDDNPDASLHELAQLTFQSDQAFGTLATRMIDAGLIERVAGPGRAVHHKLTERGLAVRRAGDKILDRVLVESFSALSAAQLATLGSLLAKVLGPDAPGEQ